MYRVYRDKHTFDGIFTSSNKSSSLSTLNDCNGWINSSLYSLYISISLSSNSSSLLSFSSNENSVTNSVTNSVFYNNNT